MLTQSEAIDNLFDPKPLLYLVQETIGIDSFMVIEFGPYDRIIKMMDQITNNYEDNGIFLVKEEVSNKKHCYLREFATVDRGHFLDLRTTETLEEIVLKENTRLKQIY